MRQLARFPSVGEELADAPLANPESSSTTSMSVYRQVSKMLRSMLQAQPGLPSAVGLCRRMFSRVLRGGVFKIAHTATVFPVACNADDLDAKLDMASRIGTKDSATSYRTRADVAYKAGVRGCESHKR